MIQFPPPKNYASSLRNHITVDPIFLPADYSWAKPNYHEGPYLSFSIRKKPVGFYATTLQLSTRISVGIYTQSQMHSFLEPNNHSLNGNSFPVIVQGIEKVLFNHLPIMSKPLRVQADFPRNTAFWQPLVGELCSYFESKSIRHQAAK
jgi:hypothetical protein